MQITDEIPTSAEIQLIKSRKTVVNYLKEQHQKSAIERLPDFMRAIEADITDLQYHYGCVSRLLYVMIALLVMLLGLSVFYLLTAV